MNLWEKLMWSVGNVFGMLLSYDDDMMIMKLQSSTIIQAGRQGVFTQSISHFFFYDLPGTKFTRIIKIRRCIPFSVV